MNTSATVGGKSGMVFKRRLDLVKILVEHEIPCEKGMEQKCLYPGDYWGNDVCRYHTHRDRTHGRKAPVERRVPKCTLFNEWLPGEYQKCEKCLEATRNGKEKRLPGATEDP